MFSHLPELIIILGIGLIVFGPEKLPEVAANAGKMVRELRGMMDTAMNPQDTQVPDDFSTYYYESLARSGEDTPTYEDDEAMLDTEEAMVAEEAGATTVVGDHESADLPAQSAE